MIATLRNRMAAKRFKRYLFDGGFSFGDEYVPPKWSISDENTKGSPFGFLEFDDEHKELCDEIVDSLNELHKKNERFESMLNDFIRTERTEIGKSVLKQLKEALEL